MSTPVDRNRLDEEESPYLRDHADNPVNWQPWDEEALCAARERDVPIFLSIGYAACHWCHVMADESFDDSEVARMLNEQFVPIKVDREERPDLDRIYQTICQQATGRGGWPLSVWLTPDEKPFYVGTYFPKTPKRGAPGFLQVLEDITNSWNDPEERKKVEERANQWTDAVTGELEEVPGTSRDPADNVAEMAAQAATRGADREHGGWGSGPKFPQTGRIDLLLRAYNRTDREVFLEVACEALDGMANGGMYDQVGGGFHRYATDNDWTVPHFEKMLYDNAELPRVFLAGYQLTDDERYATVVRETLAFIERELTHEEGGIFSTLDAQSETPTGEREEGAFYVWTPQEIREVLEDDADLFCDRFGITDRGNFEGSNVLTLAASVEELAADYDLDTGEVRDRLEDARRRVFDARTERSRPPRDEKILAGWNGLTVSAFAEAAVVLDESYAEPARDALAFVRDHLWNDDGRLQRRYKDGVTKIDGYLEDYAFLARGAVDLYQATAEVEHLAFALELARTIEDQFWDESEEALYFTPDSGESLIARPQELTDQSTPSSAGVAAELLGALDYFTEDDALGEISEQTLTTQGQRIKSNPLQHASLALAADSYTNGPLELALVTEERPEEWAEILGNRYLSPRIIAQRPPQGERFQEWLDTLGLADSPPIWSDRTRTEGEPTAYACRSYTCSPPRTDLEATLNWADRML